MDSRPRAHSSRGTPLTVKWTTESIEGGKRESERNVNRHLGILVPAFVIVLGVFGFGSWLLGERLWPVHALLSGYLTWVWLQRWGEKHFGWQSADLNEEANVTCGAAEIRKRRLAYSITGFAIGIAAVALPAWLMGEPHWIFDAVMGSVAGDEAVLGFGERFLGLSTLSDLGLARIREEMSPLDLKPDDRVPATLKTAKEVKTKP